MDAAVQHLTQTTSEVEREPFGHGHSTSKQGGQQESRLGQSGVGRILRCLFTGRRPLWWTQALDPLWPLPLQVWGRQPYLRCSHSYHGNWGRQYLRVAVLTNWKVGRLRLLKWVKELRISATLRSGFRFPLLRVQISMSLQNLTWNQFQGHVSAVSGKWQWGMRQRVVNTNRHVPSWHATGKQQSSKAGTFQGTGCVQGTWCSKGPVYTEDAEPEQVTEHLFPLSPYNNYYNKAQQQHRSVSVSHALASTTDNWLMFRNVKCKTIYLNFDDQRLKRKYKNLRSQKYWLLIKPVLIIIRCIVHLLT